MSLRDAKLRIENKGSTIEGEKKNKKTEFSFRNVVQVTTGILRPFQIIQINIKPKSLVLLLRTDQEKSLLSLFSIIDISL